MKRILLTGMSGVGKSTVLSLLRDEHTMCIDLDETNFVEIDFETGERQICVDQLISYMKTISDKDVVIAVCEANQHLVYPMMNKIILLTAPIEVMKERIKVRKNNNYGKTSEDWEKIVRDKIDIEPLLRKGADYVIQTDRELEGIIEKIKLIITNA
ncbi:hypothetical protein EII31_06990 [Leucobacter sp. OH2974_COT-288]|nr:hypothetical protein EII31_06990 [Leucobacter sp. OH2974_COT-288]